MRKLPIDRYKAILISKLPIEQYQTIKSKISGFKTTIEPTKLIGRKLTILEKSRMLIAVFLMVLILSLLISDKNLLTSNAIASDITTTSQEYLDTVQVSAAAAFLVARSLNAIISVVQTVDIGPVTPGEFFDPLNDLIERFSWIMLAVTIAISIQKFLMEIGLSLDFTWLVVCMLLLLLIRVLAQLYVSLPVTLNESNRVKKAIHRSLIAIPRDKKTRVFLDFPLMAIAAVLVVYLLIPGVGYLNAQISGSLIDERRNDTIVSIKNSKEKIEHAKDRFMNRVKELGLREIISMTKPKKYYAQAERVFIEESDNIIQLTIELMAIFILETMILPLIFFWLLFKIATIAVFPRSLRLR